MQKDFKIGMAVGLLIVTAALLWLCTRPRLATKARLLQQQNITNSRSDQSKIPDYLEAKKAQPLPQRSKKTAAPTLQYHVIRKGETLSDISMNYYGSISQWQKILNANQEHIKDANRLVPGTRIIIP